MGYIYLFIFIHIIYYSIHLCQCTLYLAFTEVLALIDPDLLPGNTAMLWGLAFWWPSCCDNTVCLTGLWSLLKWDYYKTIKAKCTHKHRLMHARTQGHRKPHTYYLTTFVPLPVPLCLGNYVKQVCLKLTVHNNCTTSAQRSITPQLRQNVSPSMSLNGLIIA